MKELLESLAAFGKNPEAVGDNLFAFFSIISKMSWGEVVAAGSAISVLAHEAFNKANAVAMTQGKEHQFDALRDPNYMRLESCLMPVIMRMSELLSEKSVEDQIRLVKMLPERSPENFVNRHTLAKWKMELGMEDK